MLIIKSCNGIKSGMDQYLIIVLKKQGTPHVVMHSKATWKPELCTISVECFFKFVRKLTSESLKQESFPYKAIKLYCLSPQRW